MSQQQRVRILPVLTCGWTGYVRPTLHLLEKDFHFLEPVCVDIPAYWNYWYLMKNFRLNKARWRREWKRWAEEMPKAFKLRSAEAAKQIEKRSADFDLIWLSGTTHAVPEKYSYVVFSDSTRRLSSSNLQDERSQLSGPHAARWLDMEKGVYAKAKQIVVGASYVKASLTQDYGIPAERIHPCGFPAGLGHAAGRQSTCSDQPTVLFVGKGDFEKKGGMILLKAFEQVKKVVPEAQLIIIGQKVHYNGAGVINVGTTKDRAELQSYYNESTVLAVPSLIDRFGMVFLEAMASGLPVIGSDYGAMPEIIGNGGYTVPRGDVPALATHILKVLQDTKKRSELSKNALSRFNDRYSDDIIRDSYGEIFNRAQTQY